MKITIDIELTDIQIHFIKEFGVDEWRMINTYHPFAWELKSWGILLSTYYNIEGKQTDDRYFLFTGLGRKIKAKLDEKET